MTYGLKDKDITAIKNVFAGFKQIEQAIIYGSRAKGNYKPASDIDITFKGNGLDTTVINKIATRLDDLLLPYTFDLSIHAHIQNPDLIEHIKRVGKVFYQYPVHA